MNKQNKMNLTKMVKMATITLAVAGLVALLATLAPGRKIQPIGWYDFNNDGTPDAIVTKLTESGHYEELAVIDGKYITKKGDTLRSKGFMQLLDMLPIQRSSSAQRTARISDVDGDGTLDLELYTSVDVEPDANCQTFYGVARR